MIHVSRSSEATVTLLDDLAYQVSVMSCSLNLFYRRRVPAPPPDCVVSSDVGLASDVGNGVAPALSSALNVMAFTHELDIGTTGEIFEQIF